MMKTELPQEANISKKAFQQFKKMTKDILFRVCETIRFNNGRETHYLNLQSEQTGTVIKARISKEEFKRIEKEIFKQIDNTHA